MRVLTCTAELDNDDDPDQKMFLYEEWSSPEAKVVERVRDVTVTLDGGTWRELGSPNEVVVQVSVRKIGEDRGND